MTRLLVIGGSDAGISAGLRARELAPEVETTLVVADDYPNYSICGIPYHLSGEVPDWRALAHRTRADLEGAGLELLTDTTARRIDPVGRTVTVTRPDGAEQILRYDRLVIGTGAVPVRPAIDGLTGPDALGRADGVHLLHTMADTFALSTALARGARTAVVIGGGYIGLEMVEALHLRGLRVTVVEQLPEVLGTVDQELGRVVSAELGARGVTVDTATTVTAVTRAVCAADRVEVHGIRAVLATDGGRTEPVRWGADIVLVVVGVRPDGALAVGAGAGHRRGAIAVDRGMRTTLPDVYAAGDCAVTYHRVLGADSYLPLGTTAHKQGRVAGENAVGGDRRFAGSLGTQVVKVFDLVAARTGLRDAEALAVGCTPVTHRTIADDHKAYYPGARPIRLHVTGDSRTGRFLGAQLLGHRDTAVAKRVDVYATALFHGMAVADIEDLDLSYSPPLGSPYDAVQIASHEWTVDSRS